MKYELSVALLAYLADTRVLSALKWIVRGGIYSRVSLEEVSEGIQDNEFSVNHIRISPEDMMKMNRTSARLNGGSGDYIATPEVVELLLHPRLLD